VDWVVLQALLDHRSILTTSLYTHVSVQRIHQVVSPLDFDTGFRLSFLA
jgi:site-specific recombinase XerD